MSNSWKQIGGKNHTNQQQDVKHKTITTESLSVLNEVNSDLSGNINVTIKRLNLTDPDTGITYGDGSIQLYSPFDAEGNVLLKNDLTVLGNTYLNGTAIITNPVFVDSDASFNSKLIFQGGNFFLGGDQGIGLNRDISSNIQYTLDISSNSQDGKAFRVLSNAPVSRNIIAEDQSHNMVIAGTDGGGGMAYLDFYTGNPPTADLNDTQIMGSAKIYVTGGPDDSQGRMVIDASRLDVAAFLNVNPRPNAEVVFENMTNSAAVFYDNVHEVDHNSYYLVDSPSENHLVKVGTALAAVAQNATSQTFAVFQDVSGRGLAIGGGFDTIHGGSRASIGIIEKHSIETDPEQDYEYLPTISIIQDPSKNGFFGRIGINNTNPSFTNGLDINGGISVSTQMITAPFLSSDVNPLSTDQTPLYIPLRCMASVSNGNSNGIIAVVGDQSLLSISQDGGYSWKTTFPTIPGVVGTPNFMKIAITPGKPNYMIIVPNQANSIYLSTDGGTTWSATNSKGQTLVTGTSGNPTINNVAIYNEFNVVATTSSLQSSPPKNNYVATEAGKSITLDNFRVAQTSDTKIDMISATSALPYSFVYIDPLNEDTWFLSPGDPATNKAGQIASRLHGLKPALTLNDNPRDLSGISYNAMSMSTSMSDGTIDGGIIVGSGSTILKYLGSSGSYQWKIISTKLGRIYPFLPILDIFADMDMDTFDIHFNDVKMLDANCAIAVGSGGAIFYTLDGGNTWKSYWDLPSSQLDSTNYMKMMRAATLVSVIPVEPETDPVTGVAPPYPNLFLIASSEGAVYRCYIPELFNLHSVSAGTIHGDLTLNGDLKTSYSTMDIATTASSIHIGAQGSTNTVFVGGSLDVSGAAVTTAQASSAVFAGAGNTSVHIGSSADGVGAKTILGKDLIVGGANLDTSSNTVFNIGAGLSNGGTCPTTIHLGSTSANTVTNLAGNALTTSTTGNTDFYLLNAGPRNLYLGGDSAKVVIGSPDVNSDGPVGSADNKVYIQSALGLDISTGILTSAASSASIFNESANSTVTIGSSNAGSVTKFGRDIDIGGNKITAVNPSSGNFSVLDSPAVSGTITFGASSPDIQLGKAQSAGGSQVVVQGNVLATANSTATFSLVDSVAPAISIGADVPLVQIGSSNSAVIQVRNTLDVSGATGTNVGKITSSMPTFYLLDASVTALQMGGATTSVAIGNGNHVAAPSSKISLQSAIVDFSGATLTTGKTTASIFDASVETMTIGGAATTVSVGSQAASTKLVLNGGSLATQNTTFNLVDTSATTINFGREATLIAAGSAGGSGSRFLVQSAALDLSAANITSTSGTSDANIFNSASITSLTAGTSAANITLGSAAAAGGAGTRVNMNGGTLATTNTTFNLVDTSATTIHFGREATTIHMGATGADSLVKTQGNLQVDGGKVMTTAREGYLFSDGVETAHICLSGNTIFIGNENSNVFFNGNITVTGTTRTGAIATTTSIDTTVLPGDIQSRQNEILLDCSNGSLPAYLSANSSSGVLGIMSQNAYTDSSGASYDLTSQATQITLGRDIAAKTSTIRLNGTTNIGTYDIYGAGPVRIRGTTGDISANALTLQSRAFLTDVSATNLSLTGWERIGGRLDLVGDCSMNGTGGLTLVNGPLIAGHADVTDLSNTHLTVGSRAWLADVSATNLQVSGQTVFQTNLPAMAAGAPTLIPTADNQFATKRYIDREISTGGGAALLGANNVWTGSNTFGVGTDLSVNKISLLSGLAKISSDGDLSANSATLAGSLYVAQDLSLNRRSTFMNYAPQCSIVPVANADLVNKSYVDTNGGQILVGWTNTWTGAQNTFQNEVSVNHLVVTSDLSCNGAHTRFTRDVSFNNAGYKVEFDGSAVFVAGPPQCSVAPTVAADLVNKSYVDTNGGQILLGASNTWAGTTNTFQNGVSVNHLVVTGDLSCNGAHTRFTRDVSFNNAGYRVEFDGSAVFVAGPPQCSVAPTVAADLVNKSYVDTNGGQILLGAANTWSGRNTFSADVSVNNLSLLSGLAKIAASGDLSANAATFASTVTTKHHLYVADTLSGFPTSTSDALSTAHRQTSLTGASPDGSIVLSHPDYTTVTAGGAGGASQGAGSIVFQSALVPTTTTKVPNFAAIQYNDTSHNNVGLQIAVEGSVSNADKYAQLVANGWNLVVGNNLVSYITGGEGVATDMCGNFVFSAVSSSSSLSLNRGGGGIAKSTVFDFSNNDGAGGTATDYAVYTSSTLRTAGGAPFSVTVWVYPTSNTYIMDIMNLYSGTSNGLQIRIGTSGSLIVSFDNSYAIETAGLTIPLNRWTHVALTISSSASNATYTLYVNGQSVAYSGISYGAFAYNRLIIGSGYTSTPTPTTTSNFRGYIADVLVYNGTNSGTGEVLSAATLLQMANAWLNASNHIVLSTPNEVGFVGINTSNPRYSLDISGNMHIGGKGYVEGTYADINTYGVNTQIPNKGYVDTKISTLLSSGWVDQYSSLMSRNNNFTGSNSFMDLSASSIALKNGTFSVGSTGRVVASDMSLNNLTIAGTAWTTTVPTQNAHVANKKYVDDLVNYIVDVSGGSALLALANTWTNSNKFNQQVSVSSIDVSGAITSKTAGNFTIAQNGDISAAGTLTLSGGGTGNGIKFSGTSSNQTQLYPFVGKMLDDSKYNTVVGVNNILSMDGSCNTAVGYKALGDGNNLSGGNNVGVGAITGSFLSSGHDNILVGYAAGHALTTGNSNIAFGTYALTSTLIGALNVAVGNQSLLRKETGTTTTAIGASSGAYDTTSYGNTYLGYEADIDLSTNIWSYSTALGFQSKITASNQIVLGRSSEFVAVPGSMSIGKKTAPSSTMLDVMGAATINGTLAVQDISQTNYNHIQYGTGIISQSGTGTNALKASNVSGSSAAANPVLSVVDSHPTTNQSFNYSFEIGSTGRAKHIGFVVNSTAGGYNTMVSAGDSSIVAGGSNPRLNLTVHEGNNTVGVRIDPSAVALYGRTVGVNKYPDITGTYGMDISGAVNLYNGGIRFQATSSNQTQTYPFVGKMLDDSKYNTVAGISGTGSSLDGTHNTAIGYKALLGDNHNSLSGNDNVGVGYYAGSNITSGVGNIAIGSLALNSTTTGYSNVAVGNNSLKNKSGNSEATAIGYLSGLNDKTCHANIYIGSEADVDSSSNTWDKSTAIGYQSKITASNQIVLGTSTEFVAVPGTISVGKKTAPSAFAGVAVDIAGGLAVSGAAKFNGAMTTLGITQDAGYSLVQSGSGVISQTGTGNNVLKDVSLNGALVMSGNLTLNGTYGQVTSASLVAHDPVTVGDKYLRFTTDDASTYIQAYSTEASDSRADLFFTSAYAATYHMAIKGSTGNIGIGTNTPVCRLDVSGASPSQTDGLLTVRDTNASTSSYNANPSFAIQNLNNSKQIYFLLNAGGGAYNTIVNSGDSVIYTGGGNGLTLTTGVSPTKIGMRLDASSVALYGKCVGVNKYPDITGTYALDVSGAINFTGTLYQNGSVFNNDPSGYPGATTLSSSANASITPTKQGQFYILAAGATYTYTLPAAATNAGQIINIWNNSSYVQTLGVTGSDVIRVNGTSSSSYTIPVGNVLQLQSTGSGTNSWVVISNWNTNGQITAVSFNAVSDYRVKENVVSLSEMNASELPPIENLRPVAYDNKLTGKKDMGFIAHELAESYPFLVNGEKDGAETQSVNYNGIIALLVKEIQDLKREVASLRASSEKA